MKNLNFIEGKLPPGFKTNFEPYLFNTPEHLKLQAPRWMSFHFIDREKKRVLASLHLHPDNTLAESPHKAPFGSVSFSDKLLPEQLYEFIFYIHESLRKKGITRVVLRNPPDAYQPYRAVMLGVMLMNAGYTVVRSEINTSITVTDRFFEGLIDASEHRKLKQSRKLKLKARQLSLDELEPVYSFVLSCREERGQSLSMDFKSLKKTVKALPKSFILFGVYQAEEMVAASIAIRVSSNILYNFYPAHARQFDPVSPAVLLTEALYQYCQQEGIGVLDLGTSALADAPNFGLLNFKLRLGGIPSQRVTYRKDL